MKIVGRKLSEAALAGSLEIWRKYSKDIPHAQSHGAEQILTRESTYAEDVEMNRGEDEIEIQVDEARQEVNRDASEEEIEQAIQDLSEEVDNGEFDDDNDSNKDVMIGLLKRMKCVYTFHREVRSNMLTQRMNK
jgi:uncharacterized protein YpuA (DUF1002 family)